MLPAFPPIARHKTQQHTYAARRAEHNVVSILDEQQTREQICSGYR